MDPQSVDTNKKNRCFIYKSDGKNYTYAIEGQSSFLHWLPDENENRIIFHEIKGSTDIIKILNIDSNRLNEAIEGLRDKDGHDLTEMPFSVRLVLTVKMFIFQL